MQNNEKASLSTTTANTLRSWVHFFIVEIRDLEHDAILWENRCENDLGNDATVSVDTLDARFQQTKTPHPTNKGENILNEDLHSYKFNGPALRWELASSLLSNHVVHVNGPCSPGKTNDLEMFRSDLKDKLDPGERVVADDIHVGDAPKHVVCPACCTTTEEQIVVMKRIEGRHEVLKGHVKSWKCLQGFKRKGSPAEKVEKHNNFFRACVVTKQVEMEMGFGEVHEV